MKNKIIDANKLLKKVMFSKIYRIALRNSMRAYKRIRKYGI